MCGREATVIRGLSGRTRLSLLCVRYLNMYFRALGKNQDARRPRDVGGSNVLEEPEKHGTPADILPTKA